MARLSHENKTKSRVDSRTAGDHNVRIATGPNMQQVDAQAIIRMSESSLGTHVRGTFSHVATILCLGFTAQSTRLGYVERSQIA